MTDVRIGSPSFRQSQALDQPLQQPTTQAGTRGFFGKMVDSIKDRSQQPLRAQVATLKNNHDAQAMTYAKTKTGWQEGQPLSKRLVADLTKHAQYETAARGRDAAYGLKPIVSDRYTQDPIFDIARGVAGRTYTKGEEIGGYVFVQDKRFGVEPGFEGTKNWTQADTAKMADPNHKFGQAADAFIDRHIDQGTFSDIVARELDKYPAHMMHDGSQREFLNANPGLKDQIFANLKQDPTIFGAAKQEIMGTEPKFTKLHYVKLDYKETDMRRGLTGVKVQIPEDKAKGVLHRFFGAKSKEDANRGAVREGVANDLMRVLGEGRGYATQKLKLVPTVYANGSPKLLLDSTHASDPNQPTVAFDTIGSKKRLVDGYIVKLGADDKPIKHNGRYVVDNGIQDQGRHKIKMLAMGDRDALGSTGGNKGRVGNVMVGIDPGHALEGARMKAKDINSDFSFQQPRQGIVPKSLMNLGYKNLTVFDDRPLAEKMQGVKDMRDIRASGGDKAIFDDYAYHLDGENTAFNFKDEVEGMRKDWNARRDYIVDNVFAERLKVYDFVPAHGATKEQFADQTFNALEGLEHLSSRTSDTSPSGSVQLERPRVTNRVEWHVEQDPKTGTVKFSVKGGDASAARRQLQDFMANHPGALPQGAVTSGFRHAEVSLKPSQVAAFAAALGNDNVMAHKHP